MSAESTELKFVRCPSCKSLVPSVATRCRMCGHQFDASSTKEIKETKETNGTQHSQKSREIVEDRPSFKREETKDQHLAVAEPEESENSFEEEYEGADDEENEEESSSGETSEHSRRRRRRRRRKSSQNIPLASTVSINLEEKSEPESPRERENDQKTERGNMQAVPAPNKQSSAKSTNLNNGELFAWLIHYGQNSKGEATEIRSGQFFIGRERLREADIVIAHETLSTPHVLVKAGIARGIIVQDLMSEHGTLVKRSGESSYKQYAEPVEVHHGDWLRLGEHEVLVCIVPSK